MKLRRDLLKKVSNPLTSAGSIRSSLFRLCSPLRLFLYCSASSCKFCGKKKLLLHQSGHLKVVRLDKNNRGHVVRQSSYLAAWPDVPDGLILRSLWSGSLNLANLRNDVLHAGFRKNPQQTKDIIAKTQKIIKAFKTIATAWRLED